MKNVSEQLIKLLTLKASIQYSGSIAEQETKNYLLPRNTLCYCNSFCYKWTSKCFTHFSITIMVWYNCQLITCKFTEFNTISHTTVADKILAVYNYDILHCRYPKWLTAHDPFQFCHVQSCQQAVPVWLRVHDIHVSNPASVHRCQRHRRRHKHAHETCTKTAQHTPVNR